PWGFHENAVWTRKRRVLRDGKDCQRCGLWWARGDLGCGARGWVGLFDVGDGEDGWGLGDGLGLVLGTDAFDVAAAALGESLGGLHAARGDQDAHVGAVELDVAGA